MSEYKHLYRDNYVQTDADRVRSFTLLGAMTPAQVEETQVWHREEILRLLVEASGLTKEQVIEGLRMPGSAALRLISQTSGYSEQAIRMLLELDGMVN